MAHGSSAAGNTDLIPHATMDGCPPTQAMDDAGDEADKHTGEAAGVEPAAPQPAMPDCKSDRGVSEAAGMAKAGQSTRPLTRAARRALALQERTNSDNSE